MTMLGLEMEQLGELMDGTWTSPRQRLKKVWLPQANQQSLSVIAQVGG
jgi:ABC-type proline/glycine betaine transport system permease subunit